jgi:hypothetical protein
MVSCGVVVSGVIEADDKDQMAVKKAPSTFKSELYFFRQRKTRRPVL